MRDGKIGFLFIGVSAGVVITLLATAFYWTSYERQLRLQTLTIGIADRTQNLVPLLINLEEQDLDDLRKVIKTQLVTGVVIADANLDVLDEQGREMVLPVLESVAAKRSSMKIGQYATPPQVEAERVLSEYDR